MGKKGFISKQELRSRYLNYRDSLSFSERKEKSAGIWELLKKENVYQAARIILVYMDYRSEVMTTGLVEELLSSREKRVFAPKVEGMDIRFYEIEGLEDLRAGYQGIREPESDPDKIFTSRMAKEEECLILVPGTVFDREKGRLGYGKGFYDRCLAALPELHSAALAFTCQIAGKVPVSPHDRKPDMIVTDTGVIR